MAVEAAALRMEAVGAPRTVVAPRHTAVEAVRLVAAARSMEAAEVFTRPRAAAASTALPPAASPIARRFVAAPFTALP